LNTKHKKKQIKGEGGNKWVREGGEETGARLEGPVGAWGLVTCPQATWTERKGSDMKHEKIKWGGEKKGQSYRFSKKNSAN